MGSSGGVETKKKQNGNIPQRINRVFQTPHWKLCGGASPGKPIGANRGTHRPEPVVVTRIGVNQ